MTLRNWEYLKNNYCHTLLLGNGASIAVSDSLHYRSLYAAATQLGYIDSQTIKIFEHFGTNDFEFVLLALANAHSVNKYLGIKDAETISSYDRVKAALIRTVKVVHPPYESAQPVLVYDTIARFIKHFESVFSLNYDLILYWSMMAGNTRFGPNRIKDCFLGERGFLYDNDFLRSKYGSNDGSTLVFYPHGNLLLGTNQFGEGTKMISEAKILLDTIEERWTIDGIVPLFVSESESWKKMRSIRRNAYLSHVYSNELSRKTESILIYGWSLSDQDDHILRAIKDSSPKRVAVSIYFESEDIDEEMFKIRNKLKKLVGIEQNSIDFFLSDENDIWCNENEE